MMSMPLRQLLPLFFLLTLLAGCAGQIAHREGQALLAEGHVEEGLDRLREAVRAEPTNGEFRLSYSQAREKAVTGWIEQGDASRAAGKTAEAAAYYRRVLARDPGNARARERLADMARDAQHEELLAQAQAAWAKGDGDTAGLRLRAILAENPRHEAALKLMQKIQEETQPSPAEAKLSAALRKPISIEFKDVPLKQVFEIIARTSGLNFIFDKDVRTDQKTTVFLRDSTVQNAISLVLLTNQLEQRILDRNSIVIYPNTQAKARDYQLLTVKSFFLTNSDAKAVAGTIRTLLKTRDIVVDERQNMLTLRDSPEAIRLVEKLVALYDLPEPEVMLEVEVLEVQRSQLLNLGIQWPDQLVLSPLARPADGTPGASSTGNNLTLADLKHLPLNQVGATITPLTINAKKQDGDANLLANPRIRTRNRESAKILIGNRLPNITTTATATGFVSETVQYVDVGLKLDVQPFIYLDREVTIKLSLEVSSIVNQITTKSGTLAYQIGTRNASTVLRLKDGENQVLAGLINDEERASANKIPALGDIPLLGRLFGSQLDNGQKTEIVLSITPRIIRSAQRPSLAESEFDSGTDSSLKSRSLEASPPLPSSGAGPAARPGLPAGVNPAGAPADKAVAPEPASSGDAGAAKGAAASPTSLQWQGPKEVKVGDTFNLALAIQPGEPLTSLPYSIGYEPKVLEAVSVSPGDFFRQGGAATTFSHRINRGAGNIVVTETRAGSDGAGSPGTLAVVTFKALAATASSDIALLSAAPVGLRGNAAMASMPPSQSIAVKAY